MGGWWQRVRAVRIARTEDGFVARPAIGARALFAVAVVALVAFAISQRLFVPLVLIPFLLRRRGPLLVAGRWGISWRGQAVIPWSELVSLSVGAGRLTGTILRVEPRLGWTELAVGAGLFPRTDAANAGVLAAAIAREAARHGVVLEPTEEFASFQTAEGRRRRQAEAAAMVLGTDGPSAGRSAISVTSAAGDSVRTTSPGWWRRLTTVRTRHRGGVVVVRPAWIHPLSSFALAFACFWFPILSVAWPLLLFLAIRETLRPVAKLGPDGFVIGWRRRRIPWSDLVGIELQGAVAWVRLHLRSEPAIRFQVTTAITALLGPGVAEPQPEAVAGLLASAAGRAGFPVEVVRAQPSIWLLPAPSTLPPPAPPPPPIGN